jgi:excisionase family DNA binding protein
MATAVPQFETITQAAQRLGVHPKTLRRRIAEGKLPAYRLGHQIVRLNPADVDALLRQVPSAAA